MITETKKSKTIQEIIDILNNYTDKKVWIKQDMIYKSIQEVEYNEKATGNVETPTKAHNIFKGWTLNDELYDFNTPVTSNITLYASFEEVEEPSITHTPTTWVRDKVLVTIGNKETEGKDYTAVTSAGYQKLNGLQATAYCRIRHVGNDFERAERQREVIKAMIEKAKQCDVETLVEVVNEVASSGVVYTSLDIKEMLALVPDLPKYKVVAEDGFPKADYRGTGKLGSDGDCVLALDLVKNVEWLHEFLFDDAHHEASEVVQTNSQYIREKIAKYFPDMKYPD